MGCFTYFLLLTDCGIDLVFLIDQSGSINFNDPGNWNRSKDFIASLVSRLTFGPSDARVGLVRFSDSAQNDFFLNDFLDKQTAIDRIQALPYQGGVTNTAEALRIAREQQFTAANGDRVTVPNVIIILTDGQSTSTNTLAEATITKDEGISIFTIGVGTLVSVQELRDMSSAPQQEGETWFRSTTFQALPALTSRIVQQSCIVGQGKGKIPPPFSTFLISSAYRSIRVLGYLIITSSIWNAYFCHRTAVGCCCGFTET